MSPPCVRLPIARVHHSNKGEQDDVSLLSGLAPAFGSRLSKRRSSGREAKRGRGDDREADWREDHCGLHSAQLTDQTAYATSARAQSR